MATDWTAEQMRELGMRHAILETQGDIDGTMATLVPEPVYEFHPMRLRLVGQDAVRRYYDHLCSAFIPKVSSRLVAEWVAPHSLAQEYDVIWDPEGAAETHRVIGILYLDEATRLLGGERIYAGEACARRMLGDALYDSLPAL